MNWAHAHLIVNHVPVMGAGFALLLLLWGLRKGSPEVQDAALGGWVLTALAAGAAYLTGSYAGDLVQTLPGVVGSRIATHEEAALLALISAIATGLLAAVGLIVGRKRGGTPRWCTLGSLLLGVLTCLLMARAANLGGEIRLPEARWGFRFPSAG